MYSIQTNEDGKVVTAFYDELSQDGWELVAEEDYINIANHPDGYTKTVYLVDQSSISSFNEENGTMGAVYYSKVDIICPSEIGNDGSQHTVEFVAQPNEKVTATISIDDFQTEVTIDGTHTETISTTASSGTKIEVSVSGEVVIENKKEIEVTN